MKNFIYGDLESKYERTEFKKIPGKAPEMIFYNQAGKEMERLNIEKFSRYLQLLCMPWLDTVMWTASVKSPMSLKSTAG